MGYCPFSGSGRDTACGVATGRAWYTHQGPQARRTVEPVRTRQACVGSGSARHGVFSPVSRHQFLCRDMTGLAQARSRSQHDFSCRDRGSRWSVATPLLASRLGCCVVSRRLSRQSFWCCDMGIAIQCRDTLSCCRDMVWPFRVAIKFLVSRPNLGEAGRPCVATKNWCRDKVAPFRRRDTTLTVTTGQAS